MDLEELDALLRERLLVDAGAVATFANGLRTFLDEPLKVGGCTGSGQLPIALSGTAATSCRVPTRAEARCQLLPTHHLPAEQAIQHAV